MILPKSWLLPDHAFLITYKVDGNYTDCLMLDVPDEISLSQLIEAFYTSPAFRPERVLLGLIGKGANDRDVRQLAAGEVQHFAAWTVEARSDDQILLCDFQNRTRSWLMVEPVKSAGTRLYFGTAVTTPETTRLGRALSKLTFTSLLWFHKAYARALLWSAARRINAFSPAPALQR